MPGALLARVRQVLSLAVIHSTHRQMVRESEALTPGVVRLRRTPTKRARPLALVLAAAVLALMGLVAPASQAQGSRKDDIVFGPSGHPVAGATVRVCQAAATGTPCTPMATLYTDATLTVPAANPLQTDGIGNYHFYAPAGRYQIQITGLGITGTMTYPDVILRGRCVIHGFGQQHLGFRPDARRKPKRGGKRLDHRNVFNRGLFAFVVERHRK